MASLEHRLILALVILVGLGCDSATPVVPRSGNPAASPTPPRIPHIYFLLEGGDDANFGGCEAFHGSSNPIQHFFGPEYAHPKTTCVDVPAGLLLSAQPLKEEHMKPAVVTIRPEKIGQWAASAGYCGGLQVGGVGPPIICVPSLPVSRFSLRRVALQVSLTHMGQDYGKPGTPTRKFRCRRRWLRILPLSC